MFAIGVIRYPFQRAHMANVIVERKEKAREDGLLFLNFLGTGILPAIYLLTGVPQFADYSLGRLGPWALVLGAFLLTAGRAGSAESLALRRNVLLFYSVTLC